MRRSFFVTVFALLFSMASAAGMRAGAAEKLNFTMDWIIGGFHSGFYVALDRGDFKGAGFDVEIFRGFGGADTVKRVGANSANFGFADMGGLVIGRSRGTKAKAVAAIFEQTQYVYYGLKDSGIQKAKDMEGKTLGCPAGSVVRATTPALFRAGKVDAAKVKWQTMDAPMLMPSLLAGRLDLICAFWVNLPALEVETRKMGKEVVGVYYKDYGIEVYSNSILTQDERVEKQPDQVRRFLKPALEGYAFSMDHPEKAIDVFLKYQPTMNRDIAMAQLDIAIKSALTPTAKEKGLGYMREEKVTSTRDIMTEYLKLPVKVPVQDIYTNQFLPVPSVKVGGK